MRIATLLTCHNRKKITLRSLENLFQATLPENVLMETFLVDDGSTDGTGDAVRKHFPEVNVLKGDGSLFWNRGMQLAWEHASKKEFDFYLWLNDDTQLKKNALEILLADSRQLNNQAIICGTTQSTTTNEITYGGFAEANHALIVPNGEPQECYFFNGNIVLIPKAVFDRVGFLDATFQHELGDFDYGLRALKLGFKSYVASAIVGSCEGNDLPVWCNPDYSIKQRLNKFYGPLGIAPFKHFVYSKRHFGLLKATKSFFSQHIRLIYPNYWVKNQGK